VDWDPGIEYGCDCWPVELKDWTFDYVFELRVCFADVFESM